MKSLDEILDSYKEQPKEEKPIPDKISGGSWITDEHGNSFWEWINDAQLITMNDNTINLPDTSKRPLITIKNTSNGSITISNSPGTIDGNSILRDISTNITNSIITSRDPSTIVDIWGVKHKMVIDSMGHTSYELILPESKLGSHADDFIYKGKGK